MINTMTADEMLQRIASLEADKAALSRQNEFLLAMLKDLASKIPVAAPIPYIPNVGPHGPAILPPPWPHTAPFWQIPMRPMDVLPSAPFAHEWPAEYPHTTCTASVIQ
jgi:hypothetical protein